MSSVRPNSVCDTTPLRRFESQSSSSEPSSPAMNGYGVENENPELNETNNSNADDGLIGVKTIPKSDESIDQSSATLANHNNNKIELSLNNFAKTFGERKRKDDQDTQHIFVRILCDLCILACVLLPIFGLEYWGIPQEHGFFCSDETLKFPYQESTLRSWHMILMCVAVPMSLITMVEFYRAYDRDLQRFELASKEKYFLCLVPVPEWLCTCYKKIGFLIFGAGVAKLTTDIAKYSVGRLRPYFYTICQPRMSDGTTCSDKINSERYIEDFFCEGSDVSVETLKSMRLSFPSGHTNLAFFTMLYTVIYLQKRMTWKSSKMLKHLLQFVLLMFAWYTALTRVSDYKHHYTDVMAGAAIGTTYSIIVTSAMW